MPEWPVWKSAGSPASCDHLVHGVHGPVVREERLDVRVELEAAHPVFADQAAGLVGRVRPIRVDAREGDQDIGVRGGNLGDLLVPDGRAAGDGLGVDREDHGHHSPFAVVHGDVLDGRRAALAEVRPGCLSPLGAQPVLARAPDLGVRVHVDRDDPLEVDRHRRSTLPSLSTGTPSLFTASNP